MKDLKRQAVLMILCVSNAKISSARSKTFAFHRWRETLSKREIQGMKVRLAHYNEEVEQIKYQESLLRTSFAHSKNALEQKLGQLVSKIVQIQDVAAPPQRQR